MNPSNRSKAARALVIDDDRAWQDILKEILEDAGLVVDVAGNLGLASSMVSAEPHRIAVVDLSLEGKDPHNKDGLHALDLLRLHDPACVSVLLSGFATVELAVAALKEYGAYTCLQKENFQRSDFRDIIHKALASVPTPIQTRAETRVASTPLSRRPADDPASSSTTARKVLVVEDDAGWRSILFELLNDAGFQVRLCGSFGEALGSLRRERFHLAILDLALGGPASWDSNDSGEEPEGYRLLDAANEQNIPAIIVSGAAAPAEIERAYRERELFTFLEKQSFDRKAFLRAVRDAQSASQSENELDSLTQREREILDLLARGYTNPDIAEGLVISVNTVKRHIKAIFRKLDIHTRSAAAAKAAGLKPPQD